MKNSLSAICMLATLAGGCASVDTVREAQGEGVSRVYQAAYEPVFKATLAAAQTRELEVVESDKAAGRVILSHGVTWWSWGERIAVFLKPRTETTTAVEIVSKPVLAPLNFPPDWQQILLEQIEVELRSGQ